MKEKKRFLSEEEFTKWKLSLIFWLWILFHTLFILYSIFFIDINFFKDFLWIVLLCILIFWPFLVLSLLLTTGIEYLFARFWVNYYNENDEKYSETKIRSSLFQRKIFLIFSIISYVLSVFFGIFFSRTIKEIKNISEVCRIGYHQSYWITKLPEEDKNLVLESCTENQEHQHLDNIISRFLINNPNICSFNSGNIDYAMTFYSDFEQEKWFEQKRIWRTERTIERIKEIITDEINNCKRDVISKKIQLMDKDFDWNLWTEYNELVKFQKRINENLEKKLEEIKS